MCSGLAGFLGVLMVCSGVHDLWTLLSTDTSAAESALREDLGSIVEGQCASWDTMTTTEAPCQLDKLTTWTSPKAPALLMDFRSAVNLMGGGIKLGVRHGIAEARAIDALRGLDVDLRCFRIDHLEKHIFPALDEPVTFSRASSAVHIHHADDLAGLLDMLVFVGTADDQVRSFINSEEQEGRTAVAEIAADSTCTHHEDTTSTASQECITHNTAAMQSHFQSWLDSWQTLATRVQRVAPSFDASKVPDFDSALQTVHKALKHWDFANTSTAGVALQPRQIPCWKVAGREHEQLSYNSRAQLEQDIKRRHPPRVTFVTASSQLVMGSLLLCLAALCGGETGRRVDKVS